MCQEDIDILNIQGCHPKSCIMHYFPIIPTSVRPFLNNKDESFDDDLMCQLSEIIKANNLVKKFLSLGMKPNTKDLQRLVFRINTYYGNRKKEQAFCFGSRIRGDKWHTEEKRQTHQKTFMQKKDKPGARTVLGGNASLKIDQVGIPKNVCKTLTRPMVVNSLNYDLAEKLIREK